MGWNRKCPINRFKNAQLTDLTKTQTEIENLQIQ